MIHSPQARTNKGLKSFCGRIIGVGSEHAGSVSNVDCVVCLLQIIQNRSYKAGQAQARLTRLQSNGGGGPLVQSGRTSYSTATKVDTRYNTVCKCGKPAYQGFTSFECSGGCK